ncbi:hypothetical protein BU26DRAFT_504762 [Trematosphaeria pertusa]|uniref:Uncharacterized protein n=1 Tax=Trematosphaeria pertusa TaxID=390896 RepID=A0A6A6IK41_9PLEO|nr:uncharacterized protein BU26DRAFT_504762 [Trematosphaeria pertusa]KAF2250438.1 hypothetical protein BU26DRAFT_504762 [Trematosphaeria pertusa]
MCKDSICETLRICVEDPRRNEENPTKRKKPTKEEEAFPFELRPLEVGDSLSVVEELPKIRKKIKKWDERCQSVRAMAEARRKQRRNSIGDPRSLAEIEKAAGPLTDRLAWKHVTSNILWKETEDYDLNMDWEVPFVQRGAPFANGDLKRQATEALALDETSESVRRLDSASQIPQT